MQFPNNGALLLFTRCGKTCPQWGCSAVRFEAVQDYQGSPRNRPAMSGFPITCSKIKDVCVLLLESKEKYIFGRFFFFLPPNKRMLKTALETWREALFKWYCVLLYLFLHGKLHWKFKLIIEQGQIKHVRFLENRQGTHLFICFQTQSVFFLNLTM